MAEKKINVAEIFLWETLVGYVSWDENLEVASFEYSQNFLKAPIEPAPLMMPNGSETFRFLGLSKESFKGLPGFLADSLPDKFGNALINQWLATQGRKPNTFNPIERLCYVGTRGMGALEFRPILYKSGSADVPIEVGKMVALASKVLKQRSQMQEVFDFDDDQKMAEALKNLLVVGTSAGGARAKCIIALHKNTGEVRSGQVKASEDFEYWLLKLDGVSENKDKELNDPKGYGCIEFAYSQMALACGIEMSECRILEENNRAHFMTKRFDRTNNGEKLHMQTLCAMAHYDFNMAGAYSYEQALDVIRKVIKKNVVTALEQQYRRAVFNVIGRNQDDHTKNIAFLMNKQGDWSLSPAYDITYSYNPTGQWTNSHQMSINGKRDEFEVEDLLALGKKADIKKSKAKIIIEDTLKVFQDWTAFAQAAQVTKEHEEAIKKTFRFATQ